MATEAFYTCTFTYETAVQDMTPTEAAELALSVARDGSDPAASRHGCVLVEVSKHMNGIQIEGWDIEVRVPA